MEVYENLSLVDLEGEIWIDCIGFDGIYHVSNFGRVKSIARWIETRPGIGYIMKERIRKQSVSEKYSSIRCFLCKNGIIAPFVTSRLVFFSFNYNVKRLPEYFVMHKDNNWKNNRLDNLKIGTQNEISSLTFEKGKCEHLKLGNPTLSPYRRENIIYEKGIMSKLKCSNCNEVKEINEFRANRNACFKCEKILGYSKEDRILKFKSKTYKKTDIETNESVIYNKDNIEELLKFVSICTVIKYCRTKQIYYPSNRSKAQPKPFTIEILTN